MTSLVEAPTAGVGSVLLDATEPWTATTDAPWLQISGPTAGTFDALVTFTFDADPGATRTGPLTIAGETFTVTQAGAGSHPRTHSSKLHRPAG